MKRRVWRFIFFGLAILAGFAAGLGYGWGVNPTRYASVSPAALRVDYQTDFVLMTAELYHGEGDLALALARLDFLSAAPLETVNAALDYAQSHQYADADLQLLQTLATDIQQALNGLD